MASVQDAPEGAQQAEHERRQRERLVGLAQALKIAISTGTVGIAPPSSSATNAFP